MTTPDFNRMNAFQKHNALRGQGKTATAAETEGNVFDRSAARRADVEKREAEKQARREEWASPHRPATAAGGTRHSEETLRAKAAWDKETEARKHPPVAAPQPLAPDDIEGLLNIFEAEVGRGDWFPYTERNLMEWYKGFSWYVAEGNVRWSLPDMRKVAEYMAQENYFEPQVRKRGQAAARTFPLHRTLAQTEDEAQQRETKSQSSLGQGFNGRAYYNRIVAEAGSPEAKAIEDARSMPLEQLQKKIRKQIQKERERQ